MAASLIDGEKCNEARDSNGNTVMHLAYQYQRDEIAKLLEDHGFNNQLKVERNYRGLLPVDMNHRADVIEGFEDRAQLKRLANGDVSIDGEKIISNQTLKKLLKVNVKKGLKDSLDSTEFDINPDYIFLIKGSWAPVIISELMMLNLKVTEIISKITNFI